MADENRPDDFDEVINEELFTLAEAEEYAREKLKINHGYYYEHIRPLLNPKPLIVDRKKGKARALKVTKQAVDKIIYDFKKLHKERSKSLQGVING